MSLISFSWLSDFLKKKNYIWYVRTLQGPHVSQTVFFLHRPHFTDQWTRLSFGGQVHISDTISNMFSIFGVCNDCKVFMSSWQVSSDLDFIFMVYFSNTLCNRSTIFGVWKYVIYFSWAVAQDLLTLTSFSRSIAKG